MEKMETVEKVMIWKKWKNGKAGKRRNSGIKNGIMLAD
jgi:hypothetical protein